MNNVSYYGEQFGLSADVSEKVEEINDLLSSELERSDVEEFNLTVFPLGTFRCIQFADKPEEIDRMQQIVLSAISVYPRAVVHSKKELDSLFAYLRDNCDPEMYGASVYEDGYIEYCDIEYTGAAFSRTRDF